MIRPSV